MRKVSLFITFLATVLGMMAQNDIPAIDVHSHLVTDEYLKYLALGRYAEDIIRNNAMKLFKIEE